MRNIVVVPYDPRWPEQFQREALLIKSIFGGQLLSIHHIGSTAIPGLSAKPVIDMMPIVLDIKKTDEFNDAMIGLGYEPKGEFGIPGRRHFVKGGDASRTHHLHAYEPGNPEVACHLDFRDYLIAHPEEARQYGFLKISLAERFRNDIFGYMAGKDSFIKDILVKAQTWRTNSRNSS